MRNLDTQKWYMSLGKRGVTWLTNLLYGVNLHDMETCYKTIAREVVAGMTLECRRFDVEPELTAKIIRRGYRSPRSRSTITRATNTKSSRRSMAGRPCARC